MPAAGRQRGAVLPLDATLARAVRQRTSGPLLQRVGEEKLGYVASAPANAEGLKLLTAALEEIKAERRKRKLDFETDKLAKIGDVKKMKEENKRKELKDAQNVVMTEYVELLTKDADVLARLATTAPFAGADPALKLVGKKVVDKADKDVATLTVGKDAFVDTTPPSATTRKTFTRPGVGAKEYVADNRSTPTRRFAYVEKSVYQFMELISTGSMTGRYQSLQYALGEAPALRKMIAHESRIISPTGADRVEDIDLAQLAVLHQWQGSGMNQRGLSLTSSPRKGAIFGNAGDSFRSNDGVRMKIDLLKVPPDVVLINHYSADGVKSDLRSVNPELTKFPGTYNYVGSATKNRELFLERLDPDWIVDIEVHEGTGERAKPPTATGKEGRALLAEISTDVGHADYVAGFKSSVEGGVLPVTPAPAFKKGFDSGTLYVKGYGNGKTQRERFDAEARRVMAAIKLAYESATVGGGEAAALEKAKTLKPPEPKKKRVRKPKSAAAVVKPPKTAKPPEELALAMVCDTMTEQGYAAMAAIDLTGWLALTSFSRDDRDQKDIYWVGWAHSARGEPKRSVMDAGFYTLRDELAVVVATVDATGDVEDAKPKPEALVTVVPDVIGEVVDVVADAKPEPPSKAVVEEVVEKVVAVVETTSHVEEEPAKAVPEKVDEVVKAVVEDDARRPATVTKAKRKTPVGPPVKQPTTTPKATGKAKAKTKAPLVTATQTTVARPTPWPTAYWIAIVVAAAAALLLLGSSF